MRAYKQTTIEPNSGHAKGENTEDQSHMQTASQIDWTEK